MITTFKITNQKAIKLAQCFIVPGIMVIYGQNGVGKSTLLHALRHKTPESFAGREKVIYNSPYDKIGSYETIVSVLGRLENARRNIIAAPSVLDNKNRSIDEQNSISYVYDPLNKLLSALLPHLKFEGFDVADPASPKCTFNRAHGQNDPSSTWTAVDTDKLSQAEIDVISLFFPLLEHQIQRRLVPRLEVRSVTDHDDIVVLMDIPNLLVPLQADLLEYIRSIIREENEESIQFIIVTSSSALIDKAKPEELFMLMPSQQLAEGSNQLVKVSDGNLCLMPV